MANILSFLWTLILALTGKGTATTTAATSESATTTAQTPAVTTAEEAAPVEEETATIPADAGDCAILGLYKDANGVEAWDNLDPAKWTLYVRAIGTKKGRVAIGLEVGTVGGDKFRCDDVDDVTFGYDEPVDQIISKDMDWPPYGKYTCAGVHTIRVKVGYYNADKSVTWTHSKEFDVTVVKAE